MRTGCSAASALRASSMTFDAWLRDHSSPTEHEVRDVLSGNLCRCTGYQSIVAAAVMSVASTAGASASTTPSAPPSASTVFPRP